MNDENTNDAPVNDESVKIEGQRLDPEHEKTRNKLRKWGIICIAAGLPLSCLGGIGIPLLFVGLVMTMYGYAGKLARYQAAEMAPVQKDTFNYLADGTQDGVRTAAHAVGEGWAGGLGAGRLKTDSPGEAGIRCHKCNFVETADAKFCSACGAALEKSKPCPQCNELNDPDAKFCDNCGKEL